MSADVFLLKFIHRGEVEELKEAIRQGADVNAQWNQWSASMQACADGSAKCLKVLIEAKADLNARGENGMSALMCAVQEGELKCVKMLLKAKVDIEVKDVQGNGALWYALMYNQPECVQYLYKAGAQLEPYVDLNLSNEATKQLGLLWAQCEHEKMSQSIKKTSTVVAKRARL